MVINLEESPSYMECNEIFRQGYGGARTAVLAALKDAPSERGSERLVSEFVAHLIRLYEISWEKKRAEYDRRMRGIDERLASLDSKDSRIEGALEGPSPETMPDEASVTSRDRAYYLRQEALKRNKALAENERKRQELQRQAFDLIEQAEAYEADLKMNLQAYLYPYIQGIGAVDQRLTKSVIPASIGEFAIGCDTGMAPSLAQEHPGIFGDAFFAWSQTPYEALGSK